MCTNLGWDRAANREVHINVRFGRDILEVDGGVVLVLGFAEVEGELVVNGEVVVAALVHWVPEIVVLSVALLAVVARHTFRGTEAVARPVITESPLPVTLALAAVPAVDRMTEVARTAPLAVLALSVVLARLLTLPGTGDAADTVTVTLTGRAGGEVPLLVVVRAGVTRGPGPGPGPGEGGGGVGVVMVLAVPGQGSRHSSLLAGAETIALARVTPATGRVTVTAGAGVVTQAQVGQARVGLPGALLEVCGPVHALTIWEGGEVSVPVNTHLHVVTPHTHGVSTVGAALPGRAGHRTTCLGVLLAASLLTLVTGHQALLLPALLLTVPLTLVRTAAPVAGVEVAADLLGLAVRTLSGVSDDLDVLDLRTLLCVAAVTAPDAGPGGGEAGLAGALDPAHHAAVPLLRQALLHTRLLAPGLLQPPHLAGPGLHVPHTLDPVPRGEADLPLQQVAALPRAEPHQVVLGLTVEPSVDVDAGVVEDGGVTEPVQVGAKVPGDGLVQTLPGVAQDVVREELPAVALCSLTVLSVVVSVPTEHKHQSLVYAGAVKVSEAWA